jgi:hypothetical protein
MANKVWGDFNLLNSDTYQSGASQAEVYKPPTDKAAQVTVIWVHNTSDSAVIWYCYLPVTAGSAATEPQRRFKRSIPAGGTCEISPKTPFIIAAGKSIRDYAQTATVLNVAVWGREET